MIILLLKVKGYHVLTLITSFTLYTMQIYERLLNKPYLNEVKGLQSYRP